MLDDDQVSQLRAMIMDRFTAEELCDILQLEVEDLFDRFASECLEVEWSDHL